MISESKGYCPSPTMTNEFGTPIATPKAIKGVRNIKQFLDVKIDLGLDLRVSWISVVWDPHCVSKAIKGALNITQFLDVKLGLGLDFRASCISGVWDPHCDPEGNQAGPKYKAVPRS